MLWQEHHTQNNLLQCHNVSHHKLHHLQVTDSNSLTKSDKYSEGRCSCGGNYRSANEEWWRQKAYRNKNRDWLRQILTAAQIPFGGDMNRIIFTLW